MLAPYYPRLVLFFRYIKSRASKLGLISTAVLSILFEISGLSLVGWSVGWAFTFIGIYLLIPVLFPSTVKSTTRKQGFKIIITGSAFITAILYAMYFGGVGGRQLIFTPITIPSGQLFLRLLYGLLGANFVVLVGYLVYLEWRELFTPAGFAVRFLNRFFPFFDLRGDDVPEIFDVTRSDEITLEGVPQIVDPDGSLVIARQWARRVRWAVSVLFVFVTVEILLIAIYFLGFLMFVTSFLSPAPEIVVLSWFVGSAIATWLGSSTVEWRPTQEAIDIETRVVRAVRLASRSTKGLFCLLWTAGGVTVSTFWLFSSVVLITDLVANQGFRGTPEEWLFVVATILSFAITGVYGLWYWLRELNRLPFFLEDWLTNQSPTTTTSWDFRERTELQTRPPGYMILPTLLLIPIFHEMVSADTPPPTLSLIPGVLWIITLSITIFTIHHTLIAEPQPPERESIALPISTLVEIVSLWLLGDWLLEGPISTALANPAPVVALVEVDAAVNAIVLVSVFFSWFYISDYLSFHSYLTNHYEDRGSKKFVTMVDLGRPFVIGGISIIGGYLLRMGWFLSMAIIVTGTLLFLMGTYSVAKWIRLQ